jgi:hypothetical protein
VSHKPIDSFFAPFVVILGPIVACWPFIMLYMWLSVSWHAWGFDPAWQAAWVVLIVSTGIAALPSSTDLGNMLHVARQHPGQFCMVAVGIVLGVAIAWLARLPLDEWWQCMVGLVVVLAPGWVLSTIYAKKRG